MSHTNTAQIYTPSLIDFTDKHGWRSGELSWLGHALHDAVVDRLNRRFRTACLGIRVFAQDGGGHHGCGLLFQCDSATSERWFLDRGADGNLVLICPKNALSYGREAPALAVLQEVERDLSAFVCRLVHDDDTETCAPGHAVAEEWFERYPFARLDPWR